MAYGIALDLGTSGYRSHLVDLCLHGKIISTTITMRHPLPGANIMDHLHFWLDNGSDVGHSIIVETIDKLISLHGIGPEQILRLAVCGNPAQLSMFENIEVRDLAFAGESLLNRLNVKRPERKAHTIKADEIGLSSINKKAEVRIPPSIRHEIGADALAMIIQTGMLSEKGTCMVTDYGTNAEMGLMYKGELYTGSAAAGPAMEGQSIAQGMLAAPGAISDLSIGQEGRWDNHVLDGSLKPIRSGLVDPVTGFTKNGFKVSARGITGTGCVACVALGLESGIIKLPLIDTPDHKIHLENGISFGESDLHEAGKAMGAIRAGHRTLIEEVGIDDDEISTMYLAGASGTYVDPIKAQIVGLVPRILDRTVQAGNTSLKMAYDILVNDEGLDNMQDIANAIASKHIMFAMSKTFEDIYVNEIAYWDEGMPMTLFNTILVEGGYRPMPPIRRPKEMLRVARSDIPVLGDHGLKILEEVGVYLIGQFDGCIGCDACQIECPESALKVIDEGNKKYKIQVETEHCLGTACKKCESTCPQECYDFSALKIIKRS
jgi:methylamine methyltransferase corrinoid activation protein